MRSSPNDESGHETFEHTADVGVRVWGLSLAELFEQAAAALIGVLLDPETVQTVSSMRVSAEGEQPEDLLVAWLEEVLFAFEVEGFAPALARIDCLGERQLSGTLLGEPFEPERHLARSAVKAVTYHDLSIEKVGRRYEVRIVLDV